MAETEENQGQPDQTKHITSFETAVDIGLPVFQVGGRAVRLNNGACHPSLALKGPILRIFLLLIICTVVAILSFNAGVQFSAPDATETNNRPQDYGQAAFAGFVLDDLEAKHPRARVAKATDPYSRSAIAVDGPVHDSSTKLVFNAHEKFKMRSKMSGGFFYTPPHDGTVLLRVDNETQSKAPPTMTRLVKMLGSYEMATSMLFSFSPGVERRVANMFPDPMRENVFFANSPALYWDRDFNDGAGRLIVIMRIWLDRERYEEKNNWPRNNFLDNYFYTRTYDSDFEPIDSGSIMGIPTNGGSTIGDGPIEPRIFPAFNRSNIFVSFNTGMTGLNYQSMDYTLIWNYLNNQMWYPGITGYSPMLQNPNDAFPRDKHWSAFNLPPRDSNPDDSIHFVHNLDPLRVLECDGDFKCKLVYAAGTYQENLFDDLKHHLRGGTPFVHYADRYYIGFGHVTLFKRHTSDTRRYYTTNMVVFKAEPEASPPYRIVFVSDPLKISRDLLNSVPIVRYMYIEDPFIFPVGLILENRDTAVLGVHINDHTAVLLRIRGLEALLTEVIRLDKLPASTWNKKQLAEFADKTTHQFLRDGIQVGPNRFTRLLAEMDSGAVFEYAHGD